ncbi:MAG: TetR/AcrR family transcriptional regulator [Candidatus Cohnella colombiensis]|uniref:TetR/AcrR family transcriptional regulator n=1 Tax=Candidatus Cohnella colombiensis TaxID=3121368 RepID=A0AA95ETZ9_9BACL|nr:MAG: TetR/AcrR family transcriptional regulator [Cohnella sp.]
MLSLIRQNILESATRYFSMNGYAATSIQDIADDCGIAKGSLYKFFQSKEDLFIAFHDSQQNALYSEIESIRANDTISLKEAFILETACHFKFFLNNKFIMHDIKELGPSKGQIAPYFYRLRANHLMYSKDGLLRFLGGEIEPNIWDLVMMYSGTMREYIFLIVFENKPLIVSDVAAYIVDRIEEMASCIIQKKTEPILQSVVMNDYLQCELEGRTISFAACRTNLLENLLSTIKELPITNFRKAELSDAVIILQEELAKESPKSVLVRALLEFVGQQHELSNSTKLIEKYVALQQGHCN